MWSKNPARVLLASTIPLLFATHGHAQSTYGRRADSPDIANVHRTGIAMPKMRIRLAGWLDDNTVVVSTFSDTAVRFNWTRQKIVSYDLRTKQIRTLLDPGMLWCVLPHKNEIFVLEGDFQRAYAGNFNAPEPVPARYRWSAESKTFKRVDVTVTSQDLDTCPTALSGLPSADLLSRARAVTGGDPGVAQVSPNGCKVAFDGDRTGFMSKVEHANPNEGELLVLDACNGQARK